MRLQDIFFSAPALLSRVNCGFGGILLGFFEDRSVKKTIENLRFLALFISFISLPAMLVLMASERKKVQCRCVVLVVAFRPILESPNFGRFLCYQTAQEEIQV